jgi:hypothetical protein
VLRFRESLRASDLFVYAGAGAHLRRPSTLSSRLSQPRQILTDLPSVVRFSQPHSGSDMYLPVVKEQFRLLRLALRQPFFFSCLKFQISNFLPAFFLAVPIT